MKVLTGVLLMAACAFAAGTEMDTVAQTESGLVSGSGTYIRVYKGIPYAAPPVGNLRWKAPQPAKPWKGIRVAKQFTANCPQVPAFLRSSRRPASARRWPWARKLASSTAAAM